jgi:hypothetical protein
MHCSHRSPDREHDSTLDAAEERQAYKVCDGATITRMYEGTGVGFVIRKNRES